MLEAMERVDALSSSDEEEPLKLPAVAKYSAALIDLPTVMLDGEKASVKQVMLESLASGTADQMRTRVDIRNVTYTAFVGPPPRLPFLPVSKSSLTEITVLNSITFSLLPGETTLLIGGPRSGKTSLLETIAGRQVDGVTGEVFVNGAPPEQAYQRMVSYAMQGDSHAARLTVRETLTFSAWCQMPTADEHYIERRVEAVLQLLGLKHAEHTLVGGFGVPGVSGGEKRRCSIGTEWVKGPRFFLLDEPTTGLDSGAAMNIGRCLRAISEIGTPVLCALLQPSWELVQMFDKILMISGGEVVYWGPVEDVLGCDLSRYLQYFASLGFHCPLNYSASEFLSEVADFPHKFSQDPEAAGARRVATSADLVTAWRDSEMRTRMLTKPSDGIVNAKSLPVTQQASAGSFANPALAPPALKEFGASDKNTSNGSLVSLGGGEQAREVFARPLWTQFSLLMWRDFILLRRDWLSLVQQGVADVILSVLMGLLFFQLDNTQTQSKAVFGLTWFLVARLSFTSLSSMIGPYLSRAYSARQRAAQYYQMLPFAASRIALQAPVRMAQALLFSTVVYWLAGLWQSAGHYFFAMLVLAVQSGTFVVFAHAAAASIGDPMNASLAASTIVVILILFGGFLITRTRIPKPYIWVYYLSPMKYAGDALSINEFHNRHLRCTPEEMMPPASFANLSLPYPNGYSGVQVCKFTTGDELLASRGIDPESWRMWFDFAIVVVFFFAFCVLYYLAERFIRWPASTRSIGAPAPVSPTPSAKPTKARHNPQSATLTWNELEYSVPASTPSGRKVLLSKVNGYVQPGMLLALMGPSGAGKTTLLDVLAARKNVGQTTGAMLINGKPLTASYPRLIGYVEQFDMHYPLQTVQEALWFAAASRLPAVLPKAQKEEIVNDIVALLEMESLRNMLVAGLNPEEQKRLSMGVELASLPAVLFLDEPTSGLDSHGADRVMTAIEKVAQSGTSVICTIHQPSSRVFSKATHLLLLRNPGQVVYFGELGPSANTVLQYFRSLGLVCPPGMNPADFVLEASLGHIKTHQNLLSADAPTAGSVEPVSTAPQLTADDLNVAAAWSSSANAATLAGQLTSIERDGPSMKSQEDPVFAASVQQRYAISWFAQISLLFGRWIRALLRSSDNLILTCARALFLGFIFGTAMFRRPHDQRGQEEILSVCFFAAVYAFLTAMAYYPAFFIQRAVFYRERAELMYKVSAWGLSRAVMDLPGVLIGNFIFGLLAYWLAGLRSDPGAFFYFMLTLLLFSCVSLVFTQMLAAIFESMDVVGLVLASTMACFALAAGFLLPRNHIRVWMRWLNWIAFMRYYLEAIVVNEMRGDKFHCSAKDDGAQVPIFANNTLVYKHYCPIVDGKQVIKSFGLYEELQYWDTLISTALWFIMMLVFLVSLRVFKHIKR